MTRQSDRAIEDFNQAIRLSPDHADAFYNRGIPYKAKGQYDRAIEDYNQAIRLDPNYAKGVERSVKAVFSIRHRPIDSLRHRTT